MGSRPGMSPSWPPIACCPEGGSLEVPGGWGGKQRAPGSSAPSGRGQRTVLGGFFCSSQKSVHLKYTLSEFS